MSEFIRNVSRLSEMSQIYQKCLNLKKMCKLHSCSVRERVCCVNGVTVGVSGVTVLMKIRQSLRIY